MKKRRILQHLMMLVAMLIASGGTASAQMSKAMKEAMESDISTWNFSTTKTVNVDGVQMRFRLDEQGLADWYYFNGYDIAPEHLVIPDSIIVGEKVYFVVSATGYGAYPQRNTTHITLPKTMRYLGDYTFYAYSGVKEVVIPENVEKLGRNVFYQWDNQNIRFTRLTPPVMGTLTDSPNSNHIKVTVPAKSFHEYATTVGIEGQCIISDDWQDPKSFTTVNTGKCGNGELGYIVVADILPDVRTYADVNKLVITEGTIDKNDWYTLRQMPNLLYLDLSGLSIEEVPSGALDGCWQIETVILPDTLRYIRQNAFRNTGVKDIQLPSKLKEISGGSCFYNCDSLRSIVIPDSVRSLPSECFRGCNNLHKVQLSKNLASMGSYCFYSCDLYDVTFPGTLGTISYYGFAHNENLTDITFGEGNNFVAGNAFYNCNRLGETNPVVFPLSMRTIDYEAFSQCKAMCGVVFNEGLERIERNAFYNCGKLPNLTLPSTLAFCLDYPFTGCSSIKWIACYSLIPPTVRNRVITSSATGIELRVPMWSFQEYMTTPGWLEYQNNLVIDKDILPPNVVINKDFEFVLKEEQVAEGYVPNIQLKDNTEEIDDGFGHTKYERGNLTISSRSKLAIKDFNMIYSPYAKYHADQSLYYAKVNYDTYRTQYSPNSLIVKGEMRAENQSITLILYHDMWQFVSFPFDVKMSDIVPESNLTQWTVRSYDGAERAAQNFDQTWKPLAKTDVLKAGKGYIMRCYDNNSEGNRVFFTVTPDVESLTRQDLFSSQDHVTELEEHLTMSNPLLTSDRSWNLVGNPYPCYFDTRYIQTEAPFMVWDSYYKKYVAYSPVDDSYVLNPGESFFIQRPVDGDGKLVFREGGRQTYRNPNDLKVEEARELVFGGSKSNRTVLNITLSSEAGSDRTRVVFNDKAEMGYEVSRDAARFAAEDASVNQIWTVADGVQYAINERPLADGVVELAMQCGKTGTFTIALGENCGAESVILVDRQTGKSTEITATEGYTFDAHAGAITGRFYIRGNQTDAIESMEGTVQTSDTKAYNLQGQKVNAGERGVIISNGVKMLNK